MRTLAIGESTTVPVDSRRVWNDSGILLEASGVYDFSVEGDQLWYDWRQKCGADGYSLSSLRYWERFRRIKNSRWFELIGTVGRSYASVLRIGKSLQGFAPAANGELCCFANDIILMYWNNMGTIHLTVSRR